MARLAERLEQGLKCFCDSPKGLRTHALVKSLVRFLMNAASLITVIWNQVARRCDKLHEDEEKPVKPTAKKRGS